MSLLYSNMTPFGDSIISNTNNIISQTPSTPFQKFNYMSNNEVLSEEQSFFKQFMKGGAKGAKPEKKKKQIDTFTKAELIKIAKKHDVSLKTPQKEVKNKLQLFESLKRKKLI